MVQTIIVSGPLSGGQIKSTPHPRARLGGGVCPADRRGL